MIGSKHAHAVAVSALAVIMALVSCSSPSPSNGTNTNWIVCKKDDDCAKAGVGAFCGDDQVCKIALADGGSSPAALTTTHGPACTWPSALDGSSRDFCHANRTLLACMFSGGASGSCVTDGLALCEGATSCESRCQPNEYVANCGGVGPGPVPDPPAGCRSAGAIPAGVAYYCCACGS
jgi:hypothetical protein